MRLVMLFFNIHLFYSPQYLRGRFWRHVFCVVVRGHDLFINDKIHAHQHFRLEIFDGRDIGVMFKFTRQWYCRRFKFGEITGSDMRHVIYSVNRAINQCHTIISDLLPQDYF
jgi:hypothetical protein